MTDVAKLLNLQPLPEGMQLVNTTKQQLHQFVTPPPHQPGVQCNPATIKMQFHSGSDYQSYLAVYAPFQQPGASTQEELKGLLTKTMQQLRPMKLPVLSERAYYKLFLDNENVPIKYSYGQICEAVDVAQSLDRNFVVAASRLKRSSMGAVQVMEAFGLYAHMVPEQSAEYQRAAALLRWFRERFMPSGLVSKLIADETEFQINHRDTEACFSAVRLVGERFQVINEAIGPCTDKNATLPGVLPKTDFSQLIAEPLRRGGAAAHQWQDKSKLQEKQKQREQKDRGKVGFQPLSYQQQLLKTMQLNAPSATAPPSGGATTAGTDFSAEALRKRAQAKATFQTLFTTQNQAEKVSQICNFYGLNPEDVQLQQQGASNYFTPVSLQVLLLGRLSSAQIGDLTGFPGHAEIDFAEEKIQNGCASAGIRWLVDENSLEEFSQLRPLFHEMRRLESKELKGKMDQIQRARKELHGHSIDVRGFFVMEKVVAAMRGE